MDAESDEFKKKTIELKIEFLADFDEFLSDIAKDIANNVAHLGTPEVQWILMKEILLNGCAYCVAKCIATCDEEMTETILGGLIEQTLLFKKNIIESHENNKKETKSLSE